MSQQIQAQKSAQATQEQLDYGPPPVAQPEARKVSEHAKDILDEIDEILEVNAEEFVAAYVQKGGE